MMPRPPRPIRKAPITVERILDAAFTLVETEGFDALTMRRVAAALDTGPASLYAHVRNKADLDGLLIGELAAGVTVPEASSTRWREQMIDVCCQMRDQYLRYPGISRAALASSQNGVETLRLAEAMLGILLGGGVPAQEAAWAIDALFLYVSAYSYETSLASRPGESGGDVDRRVTDRDAIREEFSRLPVAEFPHTVAHATELTAGEGHERFDFTLDLMLRGLVGR